MWTERVIAVHVDSEIVFLSLHPDTGPPWHNERVIAVREEPVFIVNSTSEKSLIQAGVLIETLQTLGAR